MRVLLANLKLFYQCRALWSIYVFVASFLILNGIAWMHPFTRIPANAGGVSFTWMSIISAISMAVGVIVATMQMGVISSPLSFCLPDHRVVSRELVFLMGLAVSLLVLSIEFATDALVSLSAPYLLGVSLAAYFAGVSMGLASKYGLMMVTFGGVVLLPLSATVLDLKGSGESVATVPSAVIAILLGAGSAVAVWQWLGRTELFRRRCGHPWALSDPATREKYRWAAASFRERPVPGARADGLLLDITKRCKDGSTAKYVWGRLYAWMLPGAGGRLFLSSATLFGLGSVALAWYMDGNPVIIALAAISAGGILGHSSLNSCLLIDGGRRERFWVTMASILILGAILTLSATLAFEAMELLGLHTYTESRYAGNPEFLKLLQDLETPMNLRFVFLLLALSPISRLLEVKLGGKRGRMAFAQMALFLPVGWLTIFKRAWVVTLPVGYVASIFVLSWVLCTYGVYRIAMHSDLGRK